MSETSSSSPSSASNNERPAAVPATGEIQDVNELASRKRPAAAVAAKDEPVAKVGRVASDENASAMIDVCRTVGLTPGDRIEVRWDLHVEDESSGADAANEKDGDDTTNANDGGGGVVSRWWGAALLHPDGRAHVLAGDGECEESAAATVRVLDYDPCLEFGYPDRALEDAVFLSDRELLHLSHINGDGAGGGRTYYRREGSVWEPPSPDETDETTAAAEDLPATDGGDDAVTSAIAVNGEEGMRTVLDSVLARALGGMSDKMDRLDPAQQRVVAAKIANAKEKMLAKLMEGDGSVKTKTITPGMVKQCMEELRRDM